MNKKYYVYKHSFPDGKTYVGITNQDPEARWQNGNGYNTQKYLYNAIQEFGWDNIEHTILYENLTEDEARRKEAMLIKKFKSTYIENGYNCTTGGWAGKAVYDITFDRPVLQYSKEEVFIKRYDTVYFASKDTDISPWAIREACTAYSERCDNRQSFGPNSHLRTGYIWSFEPIIQYSLDGEYIAEYKTFWEAFSKTIILGISGCCDGRPDYPTAGGYVWRFSSHRFDQYSIYRKWR